MWVAHGVKPNIIVVRHHEKSSGFVEQRKKINGGRGTDSPGRRHPNRTNGNPTPITSPSFYRPDALPAAQLHGSRLLIYIYRSWPPYLAVVPLSTTWGRGWYCNHVIDYFVTSY